MGGTADTFDRVSLAEQINDNRKAQTLPLLLTVNALEVYRDLPAFELFSTIHGICRIPRKRLAPNAAGAFAGFVTK